MTESLTPWLALLGLGILHGINPAMGWLFAVGLGLQEEDGHAVWRALGPLALGHGLAIGAALLLAALAGLLVPLEWLRWVVAALLMSFGVRHLLRHGHPRWGGMRVGARDLVIWSFLMASAHGAGLMALPLVMAAPEPAGDGAFAHALHSHGELALAHLLDGSAGGAAAMVVHTAGYLLATGAIAALVYEKLSLRLLRSAWINFNFLWAIALVAAGLVTLLA